MGEKLEALMGEIKEDLEKRKSTRLLAGNQRRRLPWPRTQEMDNRRCHRRCEARGGRGEERDAAGRKQAVSPGTGGGTRSDFSLLATKV